jgi:hypothetical protein
MNFSVFVFLIGFYQGPALNCSRFVSLWIHAPFENDSGFMLRGVIDGVDLRAQHYLNTGAPRWREGGKTESFLGTGMFLLLPPWLVFDLISIPRSLVLLNELKSLGSLCPYQFTWSWEEGACGSAGTVGVSVCSNHPTKSTHGTGDCPGNRTTVGKGVWEPDTSSTKDSSFLVTIPVSPGRGWKELLFTDTCV